MEKDKTQPQHISVLIHKTLNQFYGEEVVKSIPREKIGEVDIIITPPKKNNKYGIK